MDWQVVFFYLVVIALAAAVTFWLLHEIKKIGK